MVSGTLSKNGGLRTFVYKRWYSETCTETMVYEPFLQKRWYTEPCINMIVPLATVRAFITTKRSVHCVERFLVL